MSKTETYSAIYKGRFYGCYVCGSADIFCGCPAVDQISATPPTLPPRPLFDDVRSAKNIERQPDQNEESYRNYGCYACGSVSILKCDCSASAQVSATPPTLPPRPHFDNERSATSIECQPNQNEESYRNLRGIEERLFVLFLRAAITLIIFVPTVVIAVSFLLFSS